jgi:hypothetical protein
MAYKDKEQAKRYAHEYYEANREKTLSRISAWRLANKERIAKQKKEYNLKNKEKIAQHKKEYYLKNKEKIDSRNIEYNKKNREILTKKRIEWAAKTPGRNAAYIRKYQASKKNRTPAWLTEQDMVVIRCFYSVAKMYNRVSNEKWHVDHVVPLNGKIVSGLHVPGNLCVVPAKENHLKNNKYEASYV